MTAHNIAFTMEKMRNHGSKRLLFVLSFPLALLFCLLIITDTVSAEPDLSSVSLRYRYAGFEGRPVSGRFAEDVSISRYYELLEEYRRAGLGISSSHIDVPLSSIEYRGEAVPVQDYNGRTAFLWTLLTDHIEFRVHAPEAGLYQLELDYYLFTDATIPATRSIQINGVHPFVEASDLVFYRYFMDRNEPVINSLGDETRPSQIDIPGWRTQRAIDSTGHSQEAFLFYLDEGPNTISMGYTRQNMAISGIRFMAPIVVLPYSEYRRNMTAAGQNLVSNTITIQAESTVIEKNSPTLRREVDLCPTVTPRSITTRVLNVMGGWRWRLGNQSLTWEIEVPETGLYNIGVRVRQAWNNGLPSFRQIAVNGEVPFEEFLSYRFPYNTSWDLHVLKSGDDLPFEVLLNEGLNTITMTVKYGNLAAVIHSIREDIQLLSDIMMRITMVTGSSPDPNYDYFIFDRLPGLEADMRNLANSMEYKHSISVGLTERTPAMANNFLTIQEQLIRMIENPFSIARRFNDLIAAQESLGVWYIELQNQPLMIDFFSFGDSNDRSEWVNAKPGLFQRLWTLVANFFASFFRNYTDVGGILDEHMPIHNTIDVWIARGMEWAEAIKEMADEDFTPYSGIAVNVNVVPAGQLVAGGVNAIMLSIISGRAPDVAIGVDVITPVEFAIRGAVQDLSIMPGYADIASRFVPATLTPFEYEGGVYALPETMNFNALFYRRDILSMLDLQIPNTRAQLYEHVLPVLYQNGMEFFFGREFSQFLFQHGGRYYTPDLRRSGFHTPEAFRAFEEYTQLFTHMGVPIQANFYQRMRMGIMPLGVGDFNLYMQLSVAAPELVGRWGIAPLPGIEREDGTIDRTAGNISMQSVMILSQSDSPLDAWEFLKWWTSAPTQAGFAREVEALIGAEARWNTANMEAFLNLPWSQEDIEVIQEQWRWAREMPTVLGGYFTNRHLVNAWTTVVMSGGNPRDALERAVREINRELRMRQEEFGFFHEDNP